MREFITQIILSLPPGANHLHPTNFKTKRRYTSNEYDFFKRKTEEYKKLNRLQLQPFQDDFYQNPRPLEIERIYYFSHSRIWTKLGRPKKIDTSNFIKALDDAIADIIGLDDSYFFKGSEVKKTTTPEHERVIVNLYEYGEEACEF